MLVAIGSENPVKIKASKNAFKKAFGKLKFVSVKIDSSVSEQPFGDDEIMKGALNRAKKARKQTGADFGVGLEGGVIETDFGLMESAWCAIVNEKEMIGFGGGMHFLIPKKVARRIRNGGELGPIMDKLTGRRDVKKHGGAIEVFTAKLLTRSRVYTQLVKMALGRFLASEWFEKC